MDTRQVRGLADESPALTSLDSRRINADVWRLAWPSVLTFALMTTNSILDRMFVGRLGRDALAAVAVGGQVMFLLVSLSMAITVGTTALVARFTGARHPDQADHATGQSLALGLAMGIGCTFVVYVSLGPLLQAMDIGGGAQAQCKAYLHWSLLGMAPMFVGNVLNAAFRGSGDTRTPLKVMLAANFVHLAGAWTLMLGHYGAPRLGLPGGGMSLAFSNYVALGAYFVVLRRSALAGSLRWPHLKLSREWAGRVLRIGVPAAVTALLRNTSLMGFTTILARTAEHTSAVASLPIGMTAESIAFMPGFGFSIAASALVGQALGARDPARSERYGWAAAWQACAVMSFMGAVFYVAAEPFARVFTNDPTVLRLAVSYLKIMAFSEPMLAFGMVLTGGLQGAGDTLRPTVVTAITFWVFRLPAAWMLALVLGLHATGAWIAMSATTILGGILAIMLFRDGKWKRVRV
jgi:putative MATE family efflux protein